MQNRLRALRNAYPGQFWLMFAGMLISTVGSSMIWPFLMIYVSERLSLPLTAAASLMTINAACGLLVSFIAGPVVDRLGRKWVMVFSLISNGLGYFLMSRADSLLMFGALMALQGAVNPLYRIGSDAMMADLIPPEKRPEGYSLLRMSNNIGISVGPAIGGLIASSSYTMAFYGAAIGLASYGLLISFFARETLVRAENAVQAVKERFGGYGRVLKDRPFVVFNLIFTLNSMCASMVWILMPVYAKHNFMISERYYGLIPTTNAIMVVLFQYLVTRLTRTHRPLPVVTLGAAFYAFAVGTVALAQNFWGFWISMVIMTIGELILAPTATTYVANKAPADMRGRYMSLYGLTWSVAAGIGPLYGGLLGDNLGPRFTWYGAAVVGWIGVIMFILLSKRERQDAPA
jgi:MFS family permease